MQIQLYYNGVDSYECVLFSSKGNGVPSVPLPIMCVYLLDVYRDVVRTCIYIHQVLLLITDKNTFLEEALLNVLSFTCTPVFTVALFTIAKTWKQPKCLLTDEWIKKMWYICVYIYIYIYIYMYIYIWEYYSAIKKNEIMPFATTWMDLQILILSEVSQTKTNII